MIRLKPLPKKSLDMEIHFLRGIKSEVDTILLMNI